MAVKIGQNASILNNKANLDFFIGGKAAALLNAAEDAYAAKQMLDQLSNAELAAIGYGDGTAGTADEVNYLRTAALAFEDVWKVITAVAPTKTLPHDYRADIRYVTPAR